VSAVIRDLQRRTSDICAAATVGALRRVQVLIELMV